MAKVAADWVALLYWTHCIKTCRFQLFLDKLYCTRLQKDRTKYSDGEAQLTQNMPCPQKKSVHGKDWLFIVERGRERRVYGRKGMRIVDGVDTVVYG